MQTQPLALTLALTLQAVGAKHAAVAALLIPLASMLPTATAAETTCADAKQFYKPDVHNNYRFSGVSCHL